MKKIAKLLSLLLVIALTLNILGCTGEKDKMQEIPSDKKVTPALKIGENFQLEKAEVRSDDGNPALYINDVKIPAIMFTNNISGNATTMQKYPNYALQGNYAGINIYQLRQNSLKKVEEEIGEIVAQDPNALFILPFWMQDAEYYIPNDVLHRDTTNTENYSIGSEVWLEKAIAYAKQIAESCLNCKYADRIIGFLPTAGFGGEWFSLSTYVDGGTFDECRANLDHFRKWLSQKYKTDEALSKAWGKNVTLAGAAIPKPVSDGPFLDPQKHMDVIDYMDYHSYSYANAINQIGLAMKEATGNTRIVACLYGYAVQLGTDANISGSLASSYLLRCEGVDAISSPLSYANRDYLSSPSWHGMSDSAKLHGKLFFSEDDLGTYMSMAQDYDWLTPSDVQTYDEIVASMWKNFASATTHALGHWWYDVYGYGNYNSPQLIHQIALMNAAAIAAAEKKQNSVTEIALVVDERSALYQTPGTVPNSNGMHSFNSNLTSIRTAFNTLGAPYDIVSFDDLKDGLCDGYKLYVFVNAYVSNTESDAAIQRLKSNDRTLVFFRTPGIVNSDSGTASSLADIYALTGLDLRLASAEKVEYEYFGGFVTDLPELLTEVPVDTIFSGFSLSNRPHMFLKETSQLKVIKKSTDGKILAASKAMNNWTSIWSDDMALLTTNDWREICKATGVHLYTEDNAVVTADSRFVAVTAKAGLKVTVNFPEDTVVYDLVSDTEYTVVNGCILLDFSKPRTYMLWRGGKEQFAMQRVDMLSTNPVDIRLNNGNDQILLEVGDKWYLKPELLTENGLNVYFDYSSTWSCDEGIATLDGRGFVVAKSPGKTTIGIEIAGFKKTITVIVA